MQEKQERRRHFRLRFPSKELASITIEGTKLTVTEISESGIRISTDAPIQLETNQVLGDLRFADGTTVRVSGRIHRKESDTIVLANVEGLSFKHVMQEQMRLLRKYPMLSF